MPSSVRRPLMSEAKQDDLYRASGCRVLTNATALHSFMMKAVSECATRNVRQFSYGVTHIIPGGLFANIVAPRRCCRRHSWINKLHELST